MRLWTVRCDRCYEKIIWDDTSSLSRAMYGHFMLCHEDELGEDVSIRRPYADDVKVTGTAPGLNEPYL